MKRKVVLITGASTGLGLSIAKKLMEEDKYFLILTSRSSSLYRFREEGIYETENIWLRDLDITENVQIKSLVNEIQRRPGHVDILINNAGISERATVEDSDKYNRQKQLDVNYLSPFELISHILPSMRENRSGKIINISSAGGFMAMPTMSSYSASKFALEAASESLWYEMRPWNISVSLVVPGFINSQGYLNTTETTRAKHNASNANGHYFHYYREMRALIKRGMTNTFTTTNCIATKIAKILNYDNPPLRVYVSFDAWVLYVMRKILPASFYHFFINLFLPKVKIWTETQEEFSRKMLPFFNKYNPQSYPSDAFLWEVRSEDKLPDNILPGPGGVSKTSLYERDYREKAKLRSR
jgi:short-subunit dehydrogenase